MIMISLCRMINACCVLHNTCEAANETYKHLWERSGTVQREWKEVYDELQLSDAEESLLNSLHDAHKTASDAKSIQAALMRHVKMSRPTGWVPRQTVADT